MPCLAKLLFLLTHQRTMAGIIESGQTARRSAQLKSHAKRRPKNFENERKELVLEGLRQHVRFFSSKADVAEKQSLWLQELTQKRN